jgi:Tfp pilus assembly protein PilF
MSNTGHRGVAVTLLAACASSTTTSTTSTNSQAKATNLLTAGSQAQVAGKATTAITDYNQAIALDSDNKFAYYHVGVIGQQQNRSSDAESFTDRRCSLTLATSPRLQLGRPPGGS